MKTLVNVTIDLSSNHGHFINDAATYYYHALCLQKVKHNEVFPVPAVPETIIPSSGGASPSMNYFTLVYASFGVAEVSSCGEGTLSSRLSFPGDKWWHFLEASLCLSCTCPAHLLVRPDVSIILAHKHPFFYGSGRRLAIMCFCLFLKKGKYEKELAICWGCSHILTFHLRPYM